MASSDRVLALCSRLARAAAAYIDSQPISEGVLFIKLRLKSSTLCVICAYAPTNDYLEEHMDAFFVELGSAIDIAARNTLVLAGDCNAQVGAEDPRHWHGSLGKSALKGDTLRTSGMAMRLLFLYFTMNKRAIVG